MSIVSIYYNITCAEILLRYNNTYYKRYEDALGYVKRNNIGDMIFIGNIDVYQYNYPLIFVTMQNSWAVLSYNGGQLNEVGSKYQDESKIDSFNIIGLPHIRFAVNEYLPGRELLDLPKKLLEDLESLTLQQLMSVYS